MNIWAVPIRSMFARRDDPHVRAALRRTIVVQRTYNGLRAAAAKGIA